MTKFILAIDHEFTWDMMYGRFLPPEENPFRKAREGAEALNSKIQPKAAAAKKKPSARERVTRKE